MHPAVTEACIALNNLAQHIKNSTPQNKTLTESYGWRHPAIDANDLANIATSLSKDIHENLSDEIDDETIKLIQKIPSRTKIIKDSMVNQFVTTSGGNAVSAYINTIQILRASILPPTQWEAIKSKDFLPSTTARKAKAAQARLDQLAPALDQLEEKIALIESAHEVIEELPIDLDELKKSREKIEKIINEVQEKFSNAILETKKQFDKTLDNARKHLSTTETESDLTKKSINEDLDKVKTLVNDINSSKNEADKLIQKCEEAYQITTSKGLAGAFEQRATSLTNSMNIWVLCLLASLVVGSIIGAWRLDELSSALNNPNPNLIGIGLQAFLSILSIGAPFWFAWISTKQISQRFKLAEDYAFKSSFAKAYEGYRKEAARIDPLLESKLMESALTRLDEAPLRLMDQGNHGSPISELSNSKSTKDILGIFTFIKEKLDEISKSSKEKEMP